MTDIFLSLLSLQNGTFCDVLGTKCLIEGLSLKHFIKILGLKGPIGPTRLMHGGSRLEIYENHSQIGLGWA